MQGKAEQVNRLYILEISDLPSTKTLLIRLYDSCETNYLATQPQDNALDTYASLYNLDRLGGEEKSEQLIRVRGPSSSSESRTS